MRRRVLATVTAVVTVATGLVGLASPTSARAATVTCTDIGFIGARGSGQAQNDHGGFGSEIYAAYQQIKTNTHFSVAPLPVTYPADSVDDFLPTEAELTLLTSGNLFKVLQAATEYVAGVEKYFASIASGVTATQTLLKTYRQQCPSERFILAGYSQGAMVMHTELLDLVATHADGTIYAVLANLLVGDGDRVAYTRANLVGTAPLSGAGVRPYFGLTNSDVPPVFASRSYEVCNANDIVCDVHLARDIAVAEKTALPPVTLFLELYAAVLVHTQSYLTSPALPQATRAIVNGLITRKLGCRSENVALGASHAQIVGLQARDTGCITAARLVRATDHLRPTSVGQTLHFHTGNFVCTTRPGTMRDGRIQFDTTCLNGRAAVTFGYRA